MVDLRIFKYKHEDEVIESLVMWFFSLVSAAYCVLLICLYVHVSFKSASYYIFFITLTITTIYVLKSHFNIKKLDIKNNLLHVKLSAGIFVGVLTTSINRFSGDDGMYLPKAVFYTENPSSLIDLSITWIAGLPLDAAVTRFQYYETFQGSIAWVLGVKYLSISHVIFPFIIGFMAFCAIYLLLGFFSSSVRIRILGSLFLIVVMMHLGETSRAYGVFTISRAHQGKSVLIYLGTYSWIYFSLKLLVTGKRIDLLNLAIIAVALDSISTTTLVFIPLLSIILYLSFIFSEKGHFGINGIKKGLNYLGALFPIILSAINFRNELIKKFDGNLSFLESNFPSDYYGQLSLIIGETHIGLNVTVLALLIIIVFSPFKKFFVAWFFSGIVLILNPLTAPIIIKYLTTENIYWRLFYILPYPLIILVSLMSFSAYLENKIKYITAVIVLLFVASFYSEYSIFRKKNTTAFSFPTFKLTNLQLEMVNNLKGLSPGTMATHPKILATAFSIYSSKHQQYFLNDDFLYFFSNTNEWHDDVANRIVAAKYLYSNPEIIGGKEAFEKFLLKHYPTYVTQNMDLTNSSEVSLILLNNGYKTVTHLQNTNYFVWEYQR